MVISKVENDIRCPKNFEIKLVDRARFSGWAKLVLILNVFGIFCSNQPCNHFLDSRITCGLMKFPFQNKLNNL